MTNNRLVAAAFALAWAAALTYSSLMARALYGDGAYTLLYHLQHLSRFNDYDFARSFASFVIQAPVLVGQRFALQSVSAYAVLLSIGLYVIPAFVWIAALLVSRPHPSLFVLTAVAVAVFGFGANFVNTEANHMMSLAWLAAVVLALPGPAPILRGIVLPLVAFALLRMYEGMLLAGPVLALWSFSAMLRAESDRERAGSIIAGMLFVVSCLIAFGAYLSPRDATNAQNFAGAVTYYWRNPQAFLLAAAACAVAAVMVPKRGIALALRALSLALSVVFLALMWRLSGFYAYGIFYNNRAFLTLFLPAVLGTLFLVHRLRPRWLALPVNGYGILLIPFAMAVANDALGTYRWSRYVETFCDVLGRDAPPAERLGELKRSGARTAWSWTHPTMSVLLRARGSKAIVANEPGQIWEPAEPATNAISIPYRGLCQASIFGASQLDTFQLPVPLNTGQYPSYVKAVSGLSHAEGWATWSVGNSVQVNLARQLPQNFQLRMKVAAAFGANRGVPVTIHAGRAERSFTVTQEPYEAVLDFDGVGPADSITIDIPHPQSPKELGSGNDGRKLGLAFVSMQIVER
jgi:hypothetical protein